MAGHPKNETTVQGRAVRDLPKVSLHDHLDGAVRPSTILELAEAAGISAPAADAAGLRRWFADRCGSGSLVAYLETFALTTAVMQTDAALTRIAREFVEDLAADGVVYGEMRWAPEQHLNGGLTPERAVRAVQRGIEEGVDAADAAGRGIRVGQLISGLRHTDRTLEMAQLAVSLRRDGVVGFDIAGPEDGFPASDHRAAFDYLAEEFFPVTVHAGEAAGVDSIRSALLDGRALRLGHGVRLAEDLLIVDRDGDNVQVTLGPVARWVRDREIALELSPSSNLQTGAISAWGAALSDHPFDLLYQLGFSVTVNVDNRTMSNTSLTRELTQLAQTFDYTLDDLEAFQFNAASAAFLPVEEREELVEIIADGFSAR